jgi:2-phosphosulfolactate phosphatase
MKVNIHQLIDGARQSRGLTVVIDVFRAFSLACYLMDRGTEKIIPVATAEKAFELKKIHPGFILIGERENKKIAGFDFGNSPSQTRDYNFSRKTVVHTTSAGTQGLVNATHADELLTGSFVNADAIVRYIQLRKPEIVSLVCMGYSTIHPVEEDTFCAEYIRAGLTDKLFDFKSAVDIIRNSSGKRFFEPANQDFSPDEDFYMCLDLNRFNFVLKAEKDKEFGLVIRKVIS